MKFIRIRMKSLLRQINLQKILIVITLLISALLILYSNYLYLRRIASFRFVDEYTNMAVGYLVSTGKVLYQQVFFHHHPLPVFISSFIQQVIPVHSLYDIVKLHRYLSIGFSFAFACILLLRFRTKAVVLITWYEVLKYYIFGYQYLAEAFIAYPIAYMTLLIFETQFEKQNISLREMILSGVLTWWIIFQREPYSLLAIFLYLWIVRQTKAQKDRILGLIVPMGLSTVTLASLSLGEYFRQLFVLNSTYAAREVGGSIEPFIQGVTYLFGYILTGLRTQHILYVFLAMLSLYVLGISLYLLKNKKQGFMIGMVILLILSGLRNPELGSLWYNMYRSIPHIVVLLCVASFFSGRTVRFILVFVLGIGMLLLPTSHFKEHRDSANEFYIHYSETDGISQVITTICENTPCKLHVDGEDSLVYWQTKLEPWFKYSVFYNVQEGHLDYAQIRQKQYKTSPPDVFYRTECKVRPGFLSTVRKDTRFVPLMKQGSPSCIWIKKELASQMRESQKASIAKHGYSLGL